MGIWTAQSPDESLYIPLTEKLICVTEIEPIRIPAHQMPLPIHFRYSHHNTSGVIDGSAGSTPSESSDRPRDGGLFCARDSAKPVFKFTQSSTYGPTGEETGARLSFPQ